MKLSRTALIAALAMLMLVFMSCSEDEEEEIFNIIGLTCDPSPITCNSFTLVTADIENNCFCELLYFWSCDDGAIVETADINIVRWNPPYNEDGEYNIYLTVTDMIDSVSSQTTINCIHSNRFQSVEILYDNPADYSYLMATVDYSGEDELYYIWQCDYGEFVETDEDSTTRWNHPASDGDYEITLVVTDLMDTISTTIDIPVEHLDMPENVILPLAVGNRWVYEDYSASYEEGILLGEETDTIEYVVSEEAIYHDQACYLISSNYYVNRADGLYRCGHIYSDETYMYDIPVLARKFPVTESDISDGTVCSIDHEVVTPAGTFSCVEYCYSDSDGDDGYNSSSYYCPGIGEVSGNSRSYSWWTSYESSKRLIEYELH